MGQNAFTQLEIKLVFKPGGANKIGRIDYKDGSFGKECDCQVRMVDEINKALGDGRITTQKATELMTQCNSEKDFHYLVMHAKEHFDLMIGT